MTLSGRITNIVHKNGLFLKLSCVKVNEPFRYEMMKAYLFKDHIETANNASGGMFTGLTVTFIFRLLYWFLQN